MATDLIYNNVILHNVLTRSFEQTIEYDDSGTDAILSRFHIEVEAIIHLQTALLDPEHAVAYVAPLVGFSGNAVSLYQQIRALLHEPRGPLFVLFNNNLALRCVYVPDGADADADVDNGPKPRSLSIEHVAHDQLFRVKFAIDCAKTECGGYPQGVLSNRWGISETMDQNFRTTRTIRGKLRICQSMGKQLHSFRPIITPTLEAGFKRESIEFAALPNGLEADYVVTDRQVHTAAPWPATSLRATFEESNETNTSFFSQIGVRLEGPPHADKRMMMARAVQIAEARLGDFNLLGDPNNQNSYIESIALAEDIGEDNAIEFRARLRRIPNDYNLNTAFIGALPAGTFGKRLQLPPIPQSYDPSVSTAPATYGYDAFGSYSSTRDPSAVLYALRCYLQSPCTGEHGMQEVFQSQLISGQGQFGQPAQPAVSAVEAAALPDWQPVSKLSTDAKTSLYFFAKGVSEYTKSAQRVQVPVAGDVEQTEEPGSAFVTLGRPQCFREITVDGERIGSAPKMPPPLDSYFEAPGNEAKLISHRVELFPPTLSVDGAKKICRARGYYKYALARAPLPTETLAAGSLPFTNFSTQLGAGDLYDAALGPAPPGSSGMGGFGSQLL